MAKEGSDPEVIKALKDMKILIVQNTSTSLREPDLYFGQDLMKQAIEVTGRYSETPLGITHWLEDTSKDIIAEGCGFSVWQVTVFFSLKQPKQKRPRGFSLPAFKVAIGGSKSVEKTILQQRPLGATS